MGEIYASTTGRPSYPLLALFRSLLRGTGYKPSDKQLAPSLAHDLLFHRFCSRKYRHLYPRCEGQ
jgi:IS5 family transposase